MDLGRLRGLSGSFFCVVPFSRAHATFRAPDRVLKSVYRLSRQTGTRCVALCLLVFVHFPDLLFRCLSTCLQAIFPASFSRKCLVIWLPVCLPNIGPVLMSVSMTTCLPGYLAMIRNSKCLHGRRFCLLFSCLLYCQDFRVSSNWDEDWRCSLGMALVFKWKKDGSVRTGVASDCRVCALQIVPKEENKEDPRNKSGKFIDKFYVCACTIPSHLNESPGGP